MADTADSKKQAAQTETKDPKKADWAEMEEEDDDEQDQEEI